MVFSHHSLDFLLNHVVFPAKLPQQEDDMVTERSGEELLARLLKKALSHFLAECVPGTHEKWRPVSCALQHMSHGWTDYEGSLTSTLQGLELAG